MEPNENRNKVEIFRSEADEKWYVRVRAGNGRILAHSQGYAVKKSAVNAAGLLASGGTLVDG